MSFSETFAGYVAACVLLLVIPASASAQVCKESNGNFSGKANLACDMRYRDQIVACDKKNPNDPNEVIGTRASCPPKPMPMIDTPNKSYIADYSPYLFQYPRDEESPGKLYSGPYALGTPGDASRTFQLFGETAPGTTRKDSCRTRLKLPSDPTSAGDWAKFIRLQTDNCTNEYILNAAIYPFQKEASHILSHDDPQNPGKLLDLQSECQPLRIAPGEQNEYNADTYLKAAWIKLLEDPTYRKTTGPMKCVPCASGGLSSEGLPCDREPHLPCGVTLSNPVKAPSPFPEVRLSSIATVPYEEINDPSHPFSPRWDFLLNDRDYSNLSMNLLGSPGVAVAIQGALKTYMTDTKNAVFCAGAKNADDETDAEKKEAAEVKVDVLEFRRKDFEKSLEKRALYNALCYQTKALYGGQTQRGIPQFIAIMGGSFCFKAKFFPFAPFVESQSFDCWKCFGLEGKVNGNDKDSQPPCTTNYLGKDLKIKGKKFPGLLNEFKPNANCGRKFDKVCRDLRAPYTSLNKLKMRYHNPKDKSDPNGDNVVLKEGALEGMTFKEYFGNHMPYPRIWDLGHSLQKTPPTDKNSQPPTDTTGQYTAIVGVGREAAANVASNAAPADANGRKAADSFTDQRCKTQGWGKQTNPLGVSFGGVQVSVPNPTSSWTETKLYQTRTLRHVGLSCLGRYEKVFKPGGAENLMALISAGEWDQLVIAKCARLPGGRTKDCQYMTIKEYNAAGNPPDDDSIVYLKQPKTEASPRAWRGYISAAKPENQYPSFGGSGNTDNLIKGLDDAEMGDIILMPNGPNDKDGLPKLAFVFATKLEKDGTHCERDKSCYVRVFEPDNGKWPDVCGTTDTWGEMKSRYYFKPGHLPKKARDEYARIGSIKDCEETKISLCEQSAWNRLTTYRIRKDIRKGCETGDKAIECGGGQ